MKFVKKGDKLEEGVMMSRGRKKGVFCRYTISYTIS